MIEKRKKQQREAERRGADRRRDQFGEKLDGTTRQQIEGALTVTESDARIEIRCPLSTKLQIEALAGRYGLTITTYLLRLHELAAAKLE